MDKFKTENLLNNEARKVIKLFNASKNGLKKADRTRLAKRLIDESFCKINALGVSRLHLVRAIGVNNDIFVD